MNKIVNLKFLCRICGNFNPKNRNLFPDPEEQRDDGQFVNKICLTFSSLILRNDHFPKYICQNCEDFVNVSYEKRKIFEQCQSHWITTTTTVNNSPKDEKTVFLKNLQEIQEHTAQIEKSLENHLPNFQKVLVKNHHLNHHRQNNHKNNISTNNKATPSCPVEKQEELPSNALKTLLTENMVFNAKSLSSLCIDYFNANGPDLLDTHLKFSLPPLSTDDEDDNEPLILQVNREKQKLTVVETVETKPAPPKKRKKHNNLFVRNVSKKRRRLVRPKERINYSEDYSDELMLMYESFGSGTKQGKEDDADAKKPEDSVTTPDPDIKQPDAAAPPPLSAKEQLLAKSHEEVENKVTEHFKVNPTSIIQINSSVSIALKVPNAPNSNAASPGRSLSISSNSSLEPDKVGVSGIVNGLNASTNNNSSSIKLKINIPEQRIVPNSNIFSESDFVKQECKTCGKALNSIKELATHNLTHLKVRLRNLNTRKLLRPCFRRGKCIMVQNQKYLRCMNCLKTYANVNAIKAHWITRRCNYYCKICGRSFSDNPLNLRRHILFKHGITQDLNRNMTVSKQDQNATVTKVVASRNAGPNVSLKSIEQLTNSIRHSPTATVRIIKREVPPETTTVTTPPVVMGEAKKRELLNKYIASAQLSKLDRVRPLHIQPAPPRMSNLTSKIIMQHQQQQEQIHRMRTLGSAPRFPGPRKIHKNVGVLGSGGPVGVGQGVTVRPVGISSGGRMLDSQKLKILAQNHQQQQRIEQQQKFQQNMQRLKLIKLEPRPPAMGQLQPVSTPLLLQQQQQPQQQVFQMPNHTMSVPPLALLQPQQPQQQQQQQQQQVQQQQSAVASSMSFGGRRLVPILPKPQPYFPPQNHTIVQQQQVPPMINYNTPIAPTPTACPLCGLQFFNKSEFFVHKQQCTDQSQQQTCPYCYKLFLTASDLQVHIMCIHPEVEN